MFCGNCGKEIIDTKFCPYCGAEQTAVVIPMSVPVSAQINEPEDIAGETADTSVPAPEIQSEPAEQNGAQSLPSDDPSLLSEETPVAETVEPPIAAGLPTPNPIPTGNIDLPETAVYTSAPVQTGQTAKQAMSTPIAQAAQMSSVQSYPQTGMFMSEIAIRDEEKTDSKNKYSLKHIVMCLAAAAVMAVAAGVFAGLYFSVIFTN